LRVKEVAWGGSIWVDKNGKLQHSRRADISVELEADDDPDSAQKMAEYLISTWLSNAYEHIVGSVERRLPEMAQEPTLTLTGRVMEELGADLCELLEIDDKGKAIVLKTKGFLKDKDKWIRINDIVKSFNGNWIKSGKESRWEIPKEVI